MNDAKERLLSEAMKKGYELNKQLREAEKEAEMWKEMFYELLDYHFNEGGTSPNLRFNRINGAYNTAEAEARYIIVNNNDYITATRREMWR